MEKQADKAERETEIYRELVPYLLDWYDYNARILPWREERNAYHTWISEIMLQQTRVEAVRGYYDRFLRALPDVKALAEAPEEQLLKLWEGLGYYSRVRNLQKAAKAVCAEYGGELPADYGRLKSLPGIGAYTAGAIASIAYGIPVPAVDGNVLRVMNRVTGSREDITKESVKRGLFEKLLAVMPQDRPGDFNQAVMDIGATVCIPNGEPHCQDCPVMHLCKAFREDSWREIPCKPAPKKRRVEKRTVFVIEWQGRYLLHKRPDKGLLAGLWEMPAAEAKLGRAEAQTQAEELISALLPKECLPGRLRALPPAKHIFSHVEWRMSGYWVSLSGIAKHTPPERLASDYVLVDVETMQERYSLPSAFAAYVSEILRHEGEKKLPDAAAEEK